jgi:hypothetical protein
MMEKLKLVNGIAQKTEIQNLVALGCSGVTPVMIAAAITRILPSFFVAPGEYSTPFTVGE